MKAVTTLTMNPALDMAASVVELIPDRKLRSTSRRYYPGGGGINVARAICRHGGAARAILPVGGPAGERLTALLEEEGIDYHGVAVAADTRENFVLHVESADDLYHVVMPGPRLEARDAEECLQACYQPPPAPEYMVASGSLPPGVDDEFYARVARLARHHDARLILDTSGPPLQAALQEAVYLIKLNRQEFADLADEELADDEAARRDQVRTLAACSNAEVVVVTLGSEGSLLAAPGVQIRIRPPAVEGVSPVGAGDSFVGLLTLKLAQDKSLQEALSYGVAAAAAAVLTRGTELFHSDDIERLYDRLTRDDTLFDITHSD